MQAAKSPILPSTLGWMLAVTAFLGPISSSLLAQEPKTLQAFNHYVVEAEARIARERSNPTAFLHIDSLATTQRVEVMSRLHRGEVITEKIGSAPGQVPGGLIHDWRGIAFIPGATLTQVVAFARDYDHHASYYSPDVLQSHLISAKGDDLRVSMRLKKEKLVSVVLDTEYDIHYGQIDPGHAYSVSRSTRVSEVGDPGSPNEHALRQGHDHGYMWRLNSYWSFEQAKDGVYVQCEAISLTRDIPAGLAWVIGPFVNGIPRESLQFTLNATRQALLGRNGLANERHSKSSF